MKGLLLLHSLNILGALLCGAQDVSFPQSPDWGNDTYLADYSNTSPITDLTRVPSIPPEPSSSMVTQSTKTVVRSSKAPPPPRTSPSPDPQPSTPGNMFFKKDCLPVFMVTGGLIIACTILLLSTLLLACKVCHLSRRIKTLSSNAELISNSEYWMGTAKRNKESSEPEPKETTVLMTDLNQTQAEAGNGTTNTEEGKVNQGGQTGADDKKEGEADAAKSEEAAAPAEDSSSSKPLEEATESQDNKAVAAATSEGTEEGKDAV